MKVSPAHCFHAEFPGQICRFPLCSKKGKTTSVLLGLPVARMLSLQAAVLSSDLGTRQVPAGVQVLAEEYVVTKHSDTTKPKVP